MKGEDDMLTTMEAMAILKVGRTTLFNLVKDGRLQVANRNPVLDRPRRLLFRRGDVEKLARGEA